MNKEQFDKQTFLVRDSLILASHSILLVIPI